jgi:hypothetical protein
MKSNKKIILHLCADIGSDSLVWSRHGYEVIKVGKDIGVENIKFIDGACEFIKEHDCIEDFHYYIKSEDVYGVIANPPCTEFTTARADGRARNPKEGMFLVEHCLRIIEECNPSGFWCIENPARGVLKNYLGEPQYKYEPWWFGSPWTKQTALWGDFTNPLRIYSKWEEVPKNDKLYVRPGRPKPSLAFLHKSAIHNIEEFKPFINLVHYDMSFRSLCSQKFAIYFMLANMNKGI